MLFANLNKSDELLYRDESLEDIIVPLSTQSYCNIVISLGYHGYRDYLGYRFKDDIIITDSDEEDELQDKVFVMPNTQNTFLTLLLDLFAAASLRWA